MKPGNHALKTLAISILTFAAAAVQLSAQTPPLLRIKDNLGNQVTLDASGALVPGLSAGSHSLNSGTVPSAGKVSWSGTVGNFTLSNILGQTKPDANFPNPTMDVEIGFALNAGAPGTITASYTDVGFSGTTPERLNVVQTPGVSADYAGYFGTGNLPFETTVPAGSILNNSLGKATANFNIVPVPTSPISITVVTVATLAAGGTFNNDFAFFATTPQLTLTCSASTGQVGVAYSSSLVASGGVPGYTYFISLGSLPPGLTLNASTGLISGTPTTFGPYNFTAKVVDSSGNVASNFATSTCGITVAPPGLSVSCAPITNAQVGVPYSSSLPVSGGVAPYTFSLASGILPPGLILNTVTGAITGIPTLAGAYPFVARVVDSQSTHAMATSPSCGITVAAGASTLSLTCAAATGQVGVPYNSAVVVSGGVAPFTFMVSSGALPGGLTLNTSTGAITGTPTGAGTFGYTVKVTDRNGNVAYSNCTGSCVAGTTVALNLITALGTLGNSQAFTLGSVAVTAYGYNGTPAAGGSPTALYGKNGGAGETGLGINSDLDHEINTTTFIQLDVSQAFAAGFTNPQIRIDSVQAGESYEIYGSNTLGSLGTRLTGPATAGGSFFAMPGYGTYKYIGVRAAAANVLLGGLTFVSGTNCQIVIAPPVVKDLSLTCAAATGQKGVQYNSAVVVTGGVAPFTFMVSSGALPGGLTLNTSTGAITGKPTAAGTFAYTVKVTDHAGNVAYSNCTGSCAAGTTVSLNLIASLGKLPNSTAFTLGSVAVTAYGYNGTSNTLSTPTALYGKNGGAGETGLGIASDSDFEINTTTFIQLDVSQAFAAGFTNPRIRIDSVQAGESYEIYGSNTLGSLGTKLTGPATAGGSFFTMPGYGTYKYIGVRAASANVLLGGLTFVSGTQCQIVIAPSWGDNSDGEDRD